MSAIGQAEVDRRIAVAMREAKENTLRLPEGLMPPIYLVTVCSHTTSPEQYRNPAGRQPAENNEV